MGTRRLPIIQDVSMAHFIQIILIEHHSFNLQNTELKKRAKATVCTFGFNFTMEAVQVSSQDFVFPEASQYLLENMIHINSEIEQVKDADHVLFSFTVPRNIAGFDQNAGFVPTPIRAFNGSRAWMNIYDTGIPFRAQPAGNWHMLAVAIALYVISMPLLRWHVKHRGKPYNLRSLSVLYNVVLSIFSAWSAWAIVSRVHMHIHTNGFTETMCDVQGHLARDGDLWLIYYVFYLSKFLEFVDTWLLILHDKPVIFLHWYHHAATAALVWAMYQTEIALCWVAISLNLMVHAVMYAYYAFAAMKIKCPFKHWITSFQIIQFVLDLSASLLVMSWRIAFDAFGYDHPWAAPCRGSWDAAWFGFAIIASYLILFKMFYKKAYGEKSPKSSSAVKKIV